MATPMYAQNFFDQERPTPIVLTEAPSPNALPPNWWSYFDVSPKLIDKRRDELIPALQALASRLEDKERSVAENLIRRIEINLKAYPRLKDQPGLKLPTPRPYQESYTLDEHLEIYRTLRKLRLKNEEDSDEALVLRKRITKTEKVIDSQFASYLSGSGDPNSRLLDGLQLIASRSALAVTKEELRLSKAALKHHQTLSQQFERELAQTTERINYRIIDERQLNDEIKQYSERIKQHEEALLRAEAAAVGSMGEGELDKAHHNLLSQVVVHQSILITSDKAKRLNQEIKLALLGFIKREDSVDISTMRGQAQVWEEMQKLFSREAENLAEQTRREQERARQAHTRIVQDEELANRELLRMHERRLSQAQESLAESQKLENRLYDGSLILKQLNTQVKRRSTYLELWLSNFGSFLAWVTDTFLSWGYLSLFKIGDVPVTPIGLARAIFILICAFFISKLIRRGIQHLAEGQQVFGEATLYTLQRLVHYLVLVVGFIIAFSSIGLDFRNVAIVLGALSVGIGFGLQSIVNNFLSGLIILFERNFKVGDYIELESGHWGRVTEVNVQTTVIRTRDGTDVVLPNAQIISNRLINWTMKNAYRRLRVPFMVAYGTDKELVRQLVEEAAQKVPCTIKGQRNPRYAPQVRMESFGDNGIHFELLVWMNVHTYPGRGRAKAQYLWEIEEIFSKNGIVIPFPQRSLHIQNRQTSTPDEEDW